LNENNNHQKIKQVLDSVIQDALKEDPALKAFHEDIESQKKIIENNEKVEPLTWVLPEKEKKICSSIDQKEKEYLQSGILKEEFSKLNSNITIIPKYRRVFQNISNIREILKDYQFDKNSLKVIEVISLLKDSLEKEESIILFESSQFSLITDLIQKILINPYFLQSLQIKIDSELEEKLILIQGYIYMKNFHEIFSINELYRKKIKNKKIFSFLGSSYAFSQKYDKAIKSFDSGLKIDPVDYELLYLKASVQRIINDKQGENTYTKFLELAPKDHRKVPESYYSLASFKLLEEKINEAIEFYNIGLSFEEKQLSCYMPYDSNTKLAVESILKTRDYFKNKDVLKEGILEKIQTRLKNILTSNNNDINVQEKEGKQRIFDFNLSINTEEFNLNSDKKNMYLTHRKQIRDMKEISNNSKSDLKKKITWLVPSSDIKNSKKREKSIKQSKKIFINELNTRRDHVLENSYMEVLVCDEPNPYFPSLHLIIRDEKQFLFNVSIINISSSLNFRLSKFKFGCIFRIYEPYVRLSLDGKVIIRIENYNDIDILDYKQNICRLCCRELNHKSEFQIKCLKCNFIYCSNRCKKSENMDISHSLICEKNNNQNKNSNGLTTILFALFDQFKFLILMVLLAYFWYK